MTYRWNPKEHLWLGVHLVKWLLIAAPTGALIGSAVALFLWALDWATHIRWNYPWLLWLLPVGGAVVGGMYHLLGRSVEGGNNLIMDEIHEPGGGVPARMAPLVLIGTVLTHLFGGSAGREGTAVQMGGSISSFVCRTLRLHETDTKVLLMAGIAGGFGAVFGTPVAGTIFALEVLAVGRISFEALVPCLVASIVGDRVTTAWGIHHTSYAIAPFATSSDLNWLLAGKVAAAAVLFGLASVVFAELTHGISALFKRTVAIPVLRPVIGGLIVIALVYLLGTRDYLGIGVTADPHHPSTVCIVSCFAIGGAATWSWWWKTLFTAITLGSGFKGGEVTPLFFVGAALGNTLAVLMHAPVDLFAGLGFVAVFAGATNTPIACTIMGVELFAPGRGQLMSSGLITYLAIACGVSYLLSGHSGIYKSQRVGVWKLHRK